MHRSVSMSIRMALLRLTHPNMVPTGQSGLQKALIDYGVRLSRIGDWLIRLQIVPAALSLSLATLVFWLAVTLIFGRLYCSTLCPLGAMIDLSARMRGSKRAYRYSRPMECAYEDYNHFLWTEYAAQRVTRAFLMADRFRRPLACAGHPDAILSANLLNFAVLCQESCKTEARDCSQCCSVLQNMRPRRHAVQMIAIAAVSVTAVLAASRGWVRVWTIFAYSPNGSSQRAPNPLPPLHLQHYRQ